MKEDDIEEMITDYFQLLYTSSKAQCREIVQEALKERVSTKDNEELTKYLSMGEIRKVAFSIHADKAPGRRVFSSLLPS